jgi:GNAT superfamily N-acetyltransferase
MRWEHHVVTEAGDMRCVPLTPDLLDDMDVVFGERGIARDCYCMYWRRPNRERFLEVTTTGPPPGLLGYVDGKPLGWVQVGPRSDFPTLRRSRLLKPVDSVEPWTINCFVVRAGHRRHGIGRGLLSAAVVYARWRGAEIIEAYPVDGPRSSSVDYYTGTLGMFAEHGFVEILRRNESRPIVRLALGGEDG